MSESFPAVECTIETMDRTLYASREVGDLVDAGDFILNTALYYAFGFTSGSYVNRGNRPSYIEDTSEIYRRMYITPARLEPTEEYLRRVCGLSRAAVHIGGHSVSCWNARTHRYAVKNWSAQDDPNKGKNIPKFGRERVLDQQNLFTAYILLYDLDAESVEIPRYIRIGKKRSKARVTTRIVECEIGEGEFLSNHPFGIYDYEEVPIGDLVSVRMRPVPLIIQARYRGMYVRIPDAGRGDVVLPYKLEFLKNKR
ncbi:type I-D CRISPR-associated protein Cas5/Csc1 [Methanothrix sp.]|uniref:type I-D CRISPR-associated protein Cas5/Csc1 n=1 Tax=Methanothrix sp. TaxID=90426 RepID=UPI003C71F54E